MFKRLRDIDFRKNNQFFPKLSKPELKLLPKRTSSLSWTRLHQSRVFITLYWAFVYFDDK